MQLLKSFVFVILFFGFIFGQQTTFELPVQLVGFPFIVGSVRLTNFLKKLSYSLSPATYRSRNRRELTFASDVPEFDAQEVEKYITGEFGARACVFERVCAQFATRALAQPKPQMDWSQVFRMSVSSFQCLLMSLEPHIRKKYTNMRNPVEPIEMLGITLSQYKSSSDQAKELYLLSVFLGDIVGSPQLCHQLGKRRGCDENLLGNIEI